jgi:translation initiation factor 3 subunit E
VTEIHPALAALPHHKRHHLSNFLDLRASTLLVPFPRITAKMASEAKQTNGIPTVGDFDLLPKLITRLDRQLIFPLLNFRTEQLEDSEADDATHAEQSKQLSRATYELLKKTNMTDYVADLYCQLEGLKEPPARFAEQRQAVLKKLEQYESETEKLRELLTNDDVIQNLRSDKVANLEFLKKDYDVRCHQPLDCTTSIC